MNGFDDGRNRKGVPIVQADGALGLKLGYLAIRLTIPGEYLNGEGASHMLAEGPKWFGVDSSLLIMQLRGLYRAGVPARRYRVTV